MFAEIERMVPWEALIDLIKPFYPKTGPNSGLRPHPLQTKRGIDQIQQRTSLNDPPMEDFLTEMSRTQLFS